MLSIKPIGSSGVEYYSSLGKEDYYVNGGEPPGKWWGDGADALGLTGEIKKEHLKNVLLGVSPDGKKNLVQNALDKNRRAAFDLTFSVPKSVSVFWSQANFLERLRIESACKTALLETLKTLDELCGVTRRGKAGELVEKAKLIGGIFKHDTARGLPGKTPDPQLHFHVVLLNAVVREDGTTGAFDGRLLFKQHMKMALGAMFRTELSTELEQLGISSHRPEVNGKTASWFELDAVNKELLAEFSKRRREIEKWLIKHGLSGAKAAEKAALLTREAKSEFKREELFSKWRELGEKFGLSPDDIKNELQKTPPSRNKQEEKACAVKRAVKKITDERAHFSKLELLRFTAEEAQTRGLRNVDVKEAVGAELEENPEIVKLTRIDGDRHFTTREMLALEKRILEFSENGVYHTSQQVCKKKLEAAISSFETIRLEQEEAVRHITSGTGRVACVNGFAGTGKTFMLRVAKEAFEKDGFRVFGTTLSSIASEALEAGSGIKSTHLHVLLKKIEKGSQKIDAKTVIVLDEAGMVGTRMLERLVTVVEKTAAKLVLVGGQRQLQAIEAGAPFRGIAERIGCSELTEIIRQRSEWGRQAVKDFAFGEAGKALGEFSKRGLLSILDDRDDAINRMVSDWGSLTKKESVQDTLIFAGTNLEVTNINRKCQNERLKRGEISDEFLEVGAEEFHVFDRVVFTKNNAALLLKNGLTGTVTEVLGEEKTLRVNLDNGPSVLVDTRLYEDMKLGYAVTTHKGQGQTVENSFMLTGGGMTDREMSYVQASRARGETRIYTDVLSGGEDVETLATQMNRSRAKDLAHDYLLEVS